MRKETEDNNNKKDKKISLYLIYLLIKIRLIINKF